jgi:3'-phosphoadenosine 5'-phosphosulfate sulfotransferase (PAPS reductase)/FAD synthetase
MPLDFQTPDKHFPPVALDDDIRAMLARDCVVAVGVSGGKDSVACALAVDEYLFEVGHTGPRVLVHADLGVVEWRDSMQTCLELAERIAWDLIVVRRTAGDMMDRWESRWAGNLLRYSLMETISVILPWSTPGMRFCTSELKVEPIARELRRRFPGREILNASGIRRQESVARSKKPVSAPEAKLTRNGLVGRNWSPIIEWSIEDVFARIAAAGLRLHEAYTVFQASRVSCAFCIMSTANDLMAGLRATENHEIYRRMVDLELSSSFAFQGSRWLADMAPHLVAGDGPVRTAEAKGKAAERIALEAGIPRDLFYRGSVADRLPSYDEAKLLGNIRRRVSELLGVSIGFTDPDDIIGKFKLKLSYEPVQPVQIQYALAL